MISLISAIYEIVQLQIEEALGVDKLKLERQLAIEVKSSQTIFIHSPKGSSF